MSSRPFHSYVVGGLSALFLAGILTVLFGAGQVIDPDLWWHITIGRWIWANGTVPTVDLWNANGVDMPWRAYSWAAEVLFARVEHLGGVEGLWFLRVGLTALLSLSLTACFWRLSGDLVVGLLISVLVFVGSSAHLSLRPQLILWILAVWVVLLSWQDLRKGAVFSQIVGPLLLVSLWANVHLTAVFGVLFLAVHQSRWFSERPWRVAAVVLVGVVGLFLTPYFGGELLTLFEKADHPLSFQEIVEFRPATLQSVETWCLMILLSAVALCFHVKEDAVGKVSLVFGCGMALGGLAVVKFLPFATLLLGALLAKQISALAQTNPRFRYESGAVGVCIILAVGFIILSPFRSEQFASRAELGLAPKKAIDFIQEQELELPLGHSFGDGGYVLYRWATTAGEPAFRVGIDGRTNVTAPEVLEVHDHAQRATMKWRDYFEAIGGKTILWRNELPLSAVLSASLDWCAAYEEPEEDGYSVFVPTKSVHASRCISQSGKQT